MYNVNKHYSDKPILCLLLLSLLLIATTGFTQANHQLYQSLPKGPVGGGFGYEAMVIYDSSIFLQVNTLADLRGALANAKTRIFIPGHLSFILNSPLEIITNDLILASDRGQLDPSSGKFSKGALLKLNVTHPNHTLIHVQADNVRITGFRITRNLPPPYKFQLPSSNSSSLSVESSLHRFVYCYATRPSKCRRLWYSNRAQY